MDVPAPLRREWHREAAWLEALPRLAAECAALWDLRLEKPFETPHSFVVPAGDAVLKLNAPSHAEAEHEADALAAWRGNGAVRLLARDDGRRALLLERCRPGTRLADTDTDDVSVIGGLLLELAVVLPHRHPVRSLVDEGERWTELVLRRYEDVGTPFERSLLDLAVAVFQSADRSARSLVNQDLHGGNVLAAERRPWLVIDPKPLVGEPELDCVGLLRNAAWSPSPRRSVRRWLDGLAELGLDRDRLRDWGAAHALAWGWRPGEGWVERHVNAARLIARA